MMKNEQIVAVALLTAVLLATVFFMKNSPADPSKKEGNNSACKRTGVVASQAEITGLQI